MDQDLNSGKSINSDYQKFIPDNIQVSVDESYNEAEVEEIVEE